MASEKRVVAAWTAAVSQVNCSTPIDTRSRRSKNIMQRQTGLHLGATPDELQSRLLNAPHDGGDGSAQAMLIDYARSGRYDHVRTFITSDLARAATARDAPLRPFFTEGLSDPARGYWSILGYIRVAEAEAYRDLVRLLLDTRLPLDHRAHAAKCLARQSGQHFDRGAPSDPGLWSERHIRMAEIRAWLDGGCPAGPGYDEPARHPALDFPRDTLRGAGCEARQETGEEA